jgi:hypothetical protein
MRKASASATTAARQASFRHAIPTLNKAPPAAKAEGGRFDAEWRRGARLRCPMWLLGNSTVEKDVAEARAKTAEDIAATHAVRDALGPAVPL